MTDPVINQGTKVDWNQKAFDALKGDYPFNVMNYTKETGLVDTRYSANLYTWGESSLVSAKDKLEKKAAELKEDDEKKKPKDQEWGIMDYILSPFTFVASLFTGAWEFVCSCFGSGDTGQNNQVADNKEKKANGPEGDKQKQQTNQT